MRVNGRRMLDLQLHIFGTDIVTFLVNSKAFISNYKFEDFGMILHSLATVVLSRSFTFRIIRLSRNTTGDIIWIL